MQVLSRLGQLVNLYVLVLAVELPVSPVKQVNELVARLATLVDEVPRFFRNYLFNFRGKVFERITRAFSLLTIALVRLNVLFLTLLPQLLLFKYLQPVCFFLLSKYLLLDSLVIVHLFLHDVVFNPLHLC